MVVLRKGYGGADGGAVSVKKILCCARVFSTSPSPGVSSSASLLSPVVTLVSMPPGHSPVISFTWDVVESVSILMVFCHRPVSIFSSDKSIVTCFFLCAEGKSSLLKL
jgi:hypothetical protein